MKFGRILVINLYILFIAGRSTAERDDNFKNDLAYEISNDDMDNGSQNNNVEIYEDIMLPPINETSNAFAEQGFEIDISDMERGKKGNKKNLPRNCFDLKRLKKPSGAYMIYPCDDIPLKPVEVYCNMDNGGGWTVFQRRGKYSIQQNFYLSWIRYMLGFGDVKKDFWLGNDYIHCLTKQSNNEIRIDLEMFGGNTSYANYDFFYVAGADEYYKMEVGDYSGTAGDSFTYHSGMKFSTRNEDHDHSSNRDCAEEYKGGWWYKSCYTANLNGLYNGTTTGLVWYSFTGKGVSLKATEMKIRPKYY